MRTDIPIYEKEDSLDNFSKDTGAPIKFWARDSSDELKPMYKGSDNITRKGVSVEKFDNQGAHIGYIENDVGNLKIKSTPTDPEHAVRLQDLATFVEETADLTVTSPSTESTSGTATEQNTVNNENATSINTIFAELLKLQNASMQLESVGSFQVGIDEANGNVWDFQTVVPSSNTDVMDANDITNRITYKLADVRYTSSDTVVVKKLTSQDKILWVRAYDDSDDSPLGDALQFPVEWATGDSDTIIISDLIEPTSPDLVFYFKSWGTRSDGITPDDNIEISSIVSRIESQGSGAGTGKWQNASFGNSKILQTIETDYDSIFAGKPSDYTGAQAQLISSVPSLNGDSIIVTGGTEEGIYAKEASPDQFGFDVYKRTNPTVRYISKDVTSPHAYWCIDEGVNPIFFNANYIYTGVTPDGTYSDPLNPVDTMQNLSSVIIADVCVLSLLQLDTTSETSSILFTHFFVSIMISSLIRI